MQDLKEKEKYKEKEEENYNLHYREETLATGLFSRILALTCCIDRQTKLGFH